MCMKRVTRVRPSIARRTLYPSIHHRDAHAECRKDAGVVRSSDAAGTGYDEWAGNGDPFACKQGWMPKKSGETTRYEGLIYEEYYCCEAMCYDNRCRD
jgi:hypothetical protein